MSRLDCKSLLVAIVIIFGFVNLMVNYSNSTNQHVNGKENVLLLSNLE